MMFVLHKLEVSQLIAAFECNWKKAYRSTASNHSAFSLACCTLTANSVSSVLRIAQLICTAPVVQPLLRTRMSGVPCVDMSKLDVTPRMQQGQGTLQSCSSTCQSALRCQTPPAVVCACATASASRTRSPASCVEMKHILVPKPGKWRIACTSMTGHGRITSDSSTAGAYAFSNWHPAGSSACSSDSRAACRSAQSPT